MEKKKIYAKTMKLFAWELIPFDLWDTIKMAAILVIGPTALQTCRFLPSGVQNHCKDWLHLPMERRPDWVACINTGMVDPPSVVTNPSLC